MIDLAAPAAAGLVTSAPDLSACLPVATFACDVAGNLTWANAAAEALWGRPLPPGQPARLLWTGHDPVAALLRGTSPEAGTEAIIERDGRPCQLWLAVQPVREADGTLRGAIVCCRDDVSQRRRAEAHQRALLGELNHRVKNNMQMLQGLLQAAQRDMENSEARLAIADAIQRVGAMAAAQKVLYLANDATRCDTRDFLAAVTESATHTFDGQVKLEIAAEPGFLANDAVVPLALILNELLANAARHGVDATGLANIHVALAHQDGGYALSVADQGPGFAFGRTRRRSSGLGLVNGLARQIGGTLTVSAPPGARCTLRFPDTSGGIE